jgi:hypothetical protein
MTSIMISAYNNGEFSQTGAGYGFRIKNSEVKKNSKLLVSEIFITLDNKFKNIKVTINQDTVSDGERVVFTNKEIGRWMIKNGINEWGEGIPPKFIMQHIEKNFFVVEKNST